MIVFGWSELPNYDRLPKIFSKKNKILLLTDNKKAKILIPSVKVKIIKLIKVYWKN